MSSLDNLKTRLDYAGGANQEVRMNQDKLRSLKKALLYSYQGQTAILEDNREFRCLINHDKLKQDYDDKIISIPFYDIPLNGERKGKTSEGQEYIGMKVGDTFTWKETNTKWIIIQQILEETAYFRGTIRKAEDEVVINGHSYYAWFSRDGQESLWHTKGLNSWSEMGYEVRLYITANEETKNYFHRFEKVKIKDRLWEVQMVDDITADTMLIIYLKEAFINEFAETESGESTEIEKPSTEIPGVEAAAIIGPNELYPFDNKTYTIQNVDNGQWILSNAKARINNQSSTSVDITIVTAKSGMVDLIYRRENEDDIVKTITIKSL